MYKWPINKRKTFNSLAISELQFKIRRRRKKKKKTTKIKWSWEEKARES